VAGEDEAEERLGERERFEAACRMLLALLDEAGATDGRRPTAGSV
jgi:hypothetical protein